MALSFSWQFFLTATVLITAAYYGIVGMLFYRTELFHWLKSRFRNERPDNNLPDIGMGTNIMGTAIVDQPAIRQVIQTAEELIIAIQEPESEIKQSTIIHDEILIGSVADLLQEAKILIERIAEDRTGRSESKELFNALFIRHPHLQGTTYPQAISLYICESAREKISWEIKVEDVLTWWNDN